MLDTQAYRMVASLLPGMLRSEVVRQFAAANISGSLSAEPWSIACADDRIDTLGFLAGFPADAPIQQLRMGDHFEELYRRHPEPGIVVSLKSASGRQPYYVPLPEVAAEMLVELGERNEIVKIVVTRLGRFRERAPRHWDAMTAFMEQKAAREAEAKRRAPEIAARQKRQRAVAARIATIADPDEQLDYWAANAFIWGEPAPWLPAYTAWLRAGGPERWHDAASHWNWDYGTVPLRWIVTRPDCDAATALTVFDLGSPADQPDTGDEAELMALIRERWLAGCYKARGIACESLTNLTSIPSEQHLDRVPLPMRVPISGRKVPSMEYADGFPVAAHDGAPTYG